METTKTDFVSVWEIKCQIVQIRKTLDMRNTVSEMKIHPDIFLYVRNNMCLFI